MKKKKLKPEVVEWKDLKVGDFIESKYYRMFCFKRDDSGPSCLGRQKGAVKHHFDDAYVSGGILEYTRMKPDKSFVKLSKKLLKINLDEHHLDNLSYIEALATLKKYD
jgi:hypothetical protein